MSDWILEIKGSLCNGSALLRFQFLNNPECYKSSMSSYTHIIRMNLEFIIIKLLVFMQD